MINCSKTFQDTLNNTITQTKITSISYPALSDSQILTFSDDITLELPPQMLATTLDTNYLQYITDRYDRDYYREVSVKKLNCPHCGAPVMSIDKHNCVYCGSYIIF